MCGFQIIVIITVIGNRKGENVNRNISSTGREALQKRSTITSHSQKMQYTTKQMSTGTCTSSEKEEVMMTFDVEENQFKLSRGEIRKNE